MGVTVLVVPAAATPGAAATSTAVRTPSTAAHADRRRAVVATGVPSAVSGRRDRGPPLLGLALMTTSSVRGRPPRPCGRHRTPAATSGGIGPPSPPKE